jgi:hypothetical protein
MKNKQQQTHPLLSFQYTFDEHFQQDSFQMEFWEGTEEDKKLKSVSLGYSLFDELPSEKNGIRVQQNNGLLSPTEGWIAPSLESISFFYMGGHLESI